MTNSLVERLKKISKGLGFISDVTPNYSKGRHCGMTDDETYELADFSLIDAEVFIDELLDLFNKIEDSDIWSAVFEYDNLDYMDDDWEEDEDWGQFENE